MYGRTDDAIVRGIGTRMKEMRVTAGITQKNLIERSGLSASTISQIEQGKNTSLLSLVMYLRGIEKLDMLDAFFREVTINPMALVEYEEKHPKRKRAPRGGKPTNKIESEW